MPQPYCPNELSPWARIRFADENREVGVLPRGRSESARKADSSGSGRKGERSWKRRLSSAGSKAFGHGERTGHGLPQHSQGDDGELKPEPFQQSESGDEARRLLQSRDQKGKVARWGSKKTGIHQPHNDLGGKDGISRRKSSVLHPNLPNRKHPRRAVTQGHTPELCWYMKTQKLHGVGIPSDFRDCTIHPNPGDPITPSTLSDTSLRTSQTSLHHSTPDVSFISETSATQSSTYIDTTDTSSIHSKCASNFDRSSNASSVTLSSEKQEEEEEAEEDPFLYIGKYIHNHTAKTTQHSRTHSRTSKTRTKTTPSKTCTCETHTCRTYLRSQTPTQHCNHCILPTPQPEISAALARIDAYRCSANPVFDDGAGAPIPSAKDLQEDMLLVDMYQAEMEKRCEKGVWWEGWLIIAELEEMTMRKGEGKGR